MEIRSKTIIYSKSKRKELKHRESAIQERLQKLDYLICNNLDLSKQTLDEFEEGKKELEDIFEKKGKEAIFRSKSRWVEMGEKPTRYFFNLEKRNYEEKVILQLKTRSDEIITDIKEINKEIEIYFSELLQSQLDTTLERESNNVDYKILTKTIARRIEPILPNRNPLRSVRFYQRKIHWAECKTIM